MEWLEFYEGLIADGKTTYEAAKITAEKFNRSPEYIRRKRDLIRQKSKAEQSKPIDLHKEILKAATKEIAVTDICDKLHITERIFRATIEDLMDSGYVFVEHNGIIKLSKTIIPQENVHEESWDGSKIIRFGVTSDNHYCSKYQQKTHHEALYDIFQREGINTVYNIGDLTDGFKMRPGHEHEIFIHGADDQERYVIENYPKRDGIVTKFILGNHDASHIKNGGHDIGIPIAKARPDMEYLGMYNAKVYLTPNCVLEINHPLDGASYALSYTLQKYIDSMSGGEKPNILLNGHHHKAMYIFYRNVHAFEAGTLCAQTPWMKGKRIAAHVGGWIIEVHVDDDGTIRRCKGEFIPFYKIIKNDW